MQSYEFSMVFALASPEQDPEVYVDRLFEAGCDDALLGIGRAGGIALDFIREAPDARSAVITAIMNVRAAIPHAVLVEVSPDLVGISDVAELVGRSRQNMRKLLRGDDAGIPFPFHGGSTALWHLAPVLVWLRDEKDYVIDDRLLEVAEAAMITNTASAVSRVQPAVMRELESVFVTA